MDYLELLKQIGLLILGFVMLIKGADWFVDGASRLAEQFGIPQLIIGLTIVAMGTSAPEAAISITSSISGNAGISIGNVVGSNIMNILLILGVTALIGALPIQKNTKWIEIPFVVVCSVALLGLGMWGNSVGRIDGGVLWILFIAFLVYLFLSAKKSMKSGANAVEEQEESGGSFRFLFKNRKMPVWFMVLLILIGGALIVFGADVTVDSASAIATMFGMDDRLIGLTIVAFGTSLPELITSVTAALKHKSDIAIGNIVGSNIFNILFVVGTTALIRPVAFQQEFIFDTVMAIAASVMLFVCVLFGRNKLKRWGGGLMLLSYAAYLTYIIGFKA